MNEKKQKRIRTGLIAAVILIAVVGYCANRSGSSFFYTTTTVGEEPSATEQLDGEMNETTEKPPEKECARMVVDVCGAVKEPKVLQMDAGSRVYEAIEEAGGLTENADVRTTNLAAELCDGMKLYIPTRVEVSMEEKVTGQVAGSAYVGGSTAISSNESASNSHVSQKKLNINTADAAALQTLSGVGPATAEKIIEYRNQNGAFQKIEDLLRVSGIGEKTFEKWKGSICVE